MRSNFWQLIVSSYAYKAIIISIYREKQTVQLHSQQNNVTSTAIIFANTEQY